MQTENSPSRLITLRVGEVSVSREKGRTDFIEPDPAGRYAFDE